jgi:hypothetical protein
MQRRVLPDGRVVTVMDDPQQANEPDLAEQERPGGNPPGMMRAPFNAPPRPPGEAASDPPAAPMQPGQVMPTTSAMPTRPGVTVAVPGALPVTKPGAAPPPIKPPGD